MKNDTWKRKPLSKEKRARLEKIAYKKYRESARREIKRLSDDTLESIASGVATV